MCPQLCPQLLLFLAFRAVRQMGKILQDIPQANGARTDLETHAVNGMSSRTDAADDAGLSKRQKVTSLRVASVPAESFEKQIESENPPTHAYALISDSRTCRPAGALEKAVNA